MDTTKRRALGKGLEELSVECWYINFFTAVTFFRHNMWSFSGTICEVDSSQLWRRNMRRGWRLIHRDITFNMPYTKPLMSQTKKETVISKQIIRSATSIGANANEAIYGISKADFIAKLQIALKECYESEYWLELLNRTNYIEDETYKSIINDCGQIRRMLISSINTAKKNNSKNWFCFYCMLC